MTDPPPSSVSRVAPIALNPQQEVVVTQWAADDRLWTTQQTVAFNLRIFARLILSVAAVPLVAPQDVETALRAQGYQPARNTQHDLPPVRVAPTPTPEPTIDSVIASMRYVLAIDLAEPTEATAIKQWADELEVALTTARARADQAEQERDAARAERDASARLCAQYNEAAAVIKSLRKERDKWLDAFNRSEQFQNGPTKRAEAAEARLTARAQQDEALRHAALLLAKSVPDEPIEALRESWGNSNLAVLKHWRDVVLALLADPVLPQQPG